MREVPWRTLLLLGGSVGLYGVLGAVPVDWIYARDAVSQGEIWRLLSGHWVHSNNQHAFWNLAALLILGSLFEKCLKWHLLTILLVGMMAVGSWVWLMMPTLLYYSGLSGILNSLLAAGLLCVWQRKPHWLLILTAGLALAKIGYEVIYARGLFTHTDWVAVPQVHAVGFLVGGMTMWMLLKLERWRRQFWVEDK